MIIEATSPLFGGWVGPAIVSRDHPSCRFGQSVLLVDGCPVNPQEALLAGYRIVEADEDERATLAKMRYPL